MTGLMDIKRRAQEAQGKAPEPARDSARDFRAIFQAAYIFHTQHNPPRLDADYWPETVSDITGITCTFSNDPLMIDLLNAIYTDLERSYTRMVEEQQSA